MSHFAPGTKDSPHAALLAGVWTSTTVSVLDRFHTLSMEILATISPVGADGGVISTMVPAKTALASATAVSVGGDGAHVHA